LKFSGEKERKTRRHTTASFLPSYDRFRPGLSHLLNERTHMNALNQLKKATVISLIVALIVCRGPLQNAHALNPPPDGGYPNANTAEGSGALSSLTTGSFNTATGWLALRANTTESANTADGAEALRDSNGDANTAIGSGALFTNTTGGSNTAIGANALRKNTTG